MQNEGRRERRILRGAHLRRGRRETAGILAGGGGLQRLAAVEHSGGAPVAGLRWEGVRQLRCDAGEFVAVSVSSGRRQNDGNAGGELGGSGGAALQGAATLGEERRR
jgi:hypothetical protein